MTTEQYTETAEERAYMIKFWEDQMREEMEQPDWDDPVTAEWILVNFVSNSNGRHRKKRRYPRDIHMVRNRHTGTTITLKDIPHKRLDVIAQALLSECTPPDTDYFAEFVRRLRVEAGLSG